MLTHIILPNLFKTKLLNSHVLGVNAVIEQLTLHPGPHALTAGVVMTAATVAVHALADAVLFQCGPIGPAGVLGAPVRVDDGSPQGRIGRRRTVQRPHTTPPSCCHPWPDRGR